MRGSIAEDREEDEISFSSRSKHILITHFHRRRLCGASKRKRRPARSFPPQPDADLEVTNRRVLRTEINFNDGSLQQPVHHYAVGGAESVGPDLRVVGPPHRNETEEIDHEPLKRSALDESGGCGVKIEEKSPLTSSDRPARAAVESAPPLERLEREAHSKNPPGERYGGQRRHEQRV